MDQSQEKGATIELFGNFKHEIKTPQKTCHTIGGHLPISYRCVHTTHSQFLKRETLPGSDFHIVFPSWAMDDGTEGALGWTGGELCRLLEPVGSPLLLLSRLVEPRLHVSLPMLLEVGIGDDTVTHASHGDPVGTIQ